MGGGQKTPATTTTTTAPWTGQQPYLTQGFDQAKQIYDRGPQQYFPGQTYTDMSWQTNAGLQNQQALALNGNNVVNSAANLTQNTLNGQYLSPDSNPYLKSTFDAAAGRSNQSFSNETLPALAGMFGKQGGTGNVSMELAAGQAAGQQGQNISDLAANIYGNNYQQERSRQQSAVDQSAGIRGAQYNEAQQLQNVGKGYENQQAKVLEDQINRYNFNQNAPQQALQDYMAMVTGNYGSTSASTSKSAGGSGLATGLGTAATIASAIPTAGK